MDLSNWFDDEARSIDSTTMKEFEEFVEQYLKARQVKDDIESELKEHNKILGKMEGKLRSYLEAQGMTTHKTRLGTLIVNERTTFKAPEGEGREDVVQALRDSGEIESIMGFNAAKFSSWFKAQKEADPEFALPGVREEKLIYMSFRKA